MKNFAIIIFATLATAFVAGCEPKTPVERALKQMETAVKKAEKNKAKMTKADWMEFHAKMEVPCLQVRAVVVQPRAEPVFKQKAASVLLRYAHLVKESAIHTLPNDTIARRTREVENALKDYENKKRTAAERAAQNLRKIFK